MALPLQRLDFSVADILLYQSMGVVWPKVLRRLVSYFIRMKDRINNLYTLSIYSLTR